MRVVIYADCIFIFLLFCGAVWVRNRRSMVLGEMRFLLGIIDPAAVIAVAVLATLLLAPRLHVAGFAHILCAFGIFVAASLVLGPIVLAFFPKAPNEFELYDEMVNRDK